MPKLSLKELFDESRLVNIITDQQGTMVYCSKKAYDFFGKIKIDHKKNIIEQFKQKFPLFSVKKILSETVLFHYTGVDCPNCYFEMSSYIKVIEDQSYYVFSVYDVTKYESKILESEIYETIFNSAASAIVLTDLNGTIEKVNPSFEALTGYTAEEAKGQNPSILNSGYHSKQFFKEMWQTLAEGKIWRGNLRDKLKSGDLIWEKSVISPIKNNSGEIIKYVAIKENITKEKSHEEALKKFSYQDYLTGLYNRRKFFEYVEKLVVEAKKKDIYLFALMIDVDNFKLVNDSYGHEVGDEVLVELANSLKGNVRGDDIASRYGGEEFVMVLSKYSYEEALNRAEKIRKDISNLKVKTNKNEISVTVSIGFVQYDNTSSITDWLKMADDALYEAKNTGKNRVCEYEK